MSSSLGLTESCARLSRECVDFCVGNSIQEVEGGPESALAFYRDFVATNRPAIFRNAVHHWPAIRKWSDDYLGNRLKTVAVSVTPSGYADAIHGDGKGEQLFVMPHEERTSMADFLRILARPEDFTGVYYVQSQNDNMGEDFAPLRGDVGELQWAREAFGRPPDAVNFWMGDQRAVTSTHKDPYENIYCVVRGHKDFVLLPPTDLPWLYYKDYPQGQFRRCSATGTFKIERLSGLPSVPWISVDPLQPDPERFPDYAQHANPLSVRVRAGDALYLPSLWFHHLRQSHSCIAVNFWYDMQFDARYAYLNFLSSVDSVRRKFKC